MAVFDRSSRPIRQLKVFDKRIVNWVKLEKIYCDLWFLMFHFILSIAAHTSVRLLLVFILFLGFMVLPAQAESLTDRLNAYPDWHSKPELNPNFEEVAYPGWMSGTWICESTLIDMVAPVPKVTTPGFEGNRKYLNEPVRFDVRFGPTKTKAKRKFGIPTIMNFSSSQEKVVVDRVFNGLSIARAYLGDGVVQSVKINPNLPNEQLTTLKDGLQLVSVTTGHQSERPAPNLFLTSEFFQQIFRSSDQPFLNQVETTTKYSYLPTSDLISANSNANSNIEVDSVEADRNETPTIVADQYTAIYLSPQDPNYFEAIGAPVALYRYRLKLTPAKPSI